MDKMSTNVLIACIGAVFRELKRLDEFLEREEYDNAKANLLGSYNHDLSQAYSLLLDEYDRRRAADGSMKPIQEYLDHFARPD